METKIVTLTYEQLNEMLTDASKRGAEMVLKANKMIMSEPITYTRSQVAERLNVTGRTIANWERHGMLHGIRNGGVVRYNRDEVNKLITL